MTRGICTLANAHDNDQVITLINALINSIEVHADLAIPVCISPDDEHLSKLRKFVADRPQIHF